MSNYNLYTSQRVGDDEYIIKHLILYKVTQTNNDKRNLILMAENPSHLPTIDEMLFYYYII